MAKWYEDYLRSDHWQKTRLRKLLQANINTDWNVIQCQRNECGLFVPLGVLDVHHLTYDRLGREPMEDLQVLCKSCHRVAHGLLPLLWWERAKKGGRQMIFSKSIYLDRNLKRIGDVMTDCLAYCDERHGSSLIAAGFQDTL